MNDLLTKLVVLLTLAGVRCRAAFMAAKIPLLTSPITIVDGTMTLSAAAIGDVFGKDGTGKYYNCKLAEYTALLDIYAPYIGNGGAMIEPTVRSLLTALKTEPEGYRMRSIEVGRMHYDADSDCFRCTVSVKYGAFLVLAEQGGTT